MCIVHLRAGFNLSLKSSFLSLCSISLSLSPSSSSFSLLSFYYDSLTSLRPPPREAPEALHARITLRRGGDFIARGPAPRRRHIGQPPINDERRRGVPRSQVAVLDTPHLAPFPELAHVYFLFATTSNLISLVYNFLAPPIASSVSLIWRF